MIFRKGATTHDGGRHGNASSLCEFAQLLGGVGADNSAAAVKDRALSLFNVANDFVQGHFAGAAIHVVTANLD